MSMSNEVDEPYFEHFTEGSSEVHVKVWSVLNSKWKSEEYLEETLQPVPQLMRDYVHKLTNAMPEEVIGSRYMFQVSLLKAVSKDLRDLYGQVQGATAQGKKGGLRGGHKSSRFEGDDDDISVTDVFMGRGNFGASNMGGLSNLGASFGLPSIE